MSVGVSDQVLYPRGTGPPLYVWQCSTGRLGEEAGGVVGDSGPAIASPTPLMGTALVAF